MTTHTVDRAFALLSTQRALLGNVTPELRAVTLDLSNGVLIRFVYDCPIDDHIRFDIILEVESEIGGDMPDVTVESTIESLPAGPLPITDSEVVAFHRREEDGWEQD